MLNISGVKCAYFADQKQSLVSTAHILFPLDEKRFETRDESDCFLEIDVINVLKALAEHSTRHLPVSNASTNAIWTLIRVRQDLEPAITAVDEISLQIVLSEFQAPTAQHKTARHSILFHKLFL